jgi:hypothetical protein
MRTQHFLKNTAGHHEWRTSVFACKNASREKMKKNANKNDEKEKTKNNDLGQFEEEKRNDVTVEKKEQHKDLFKIDKEFNNLGFINRDHSGKTTTGKY